MTVITTRIVVAEDGSVSLATPIPAGEYLANLEMEDPPRHSPTMIDWSTFPTFDLGPWPEGVTFSREEIYGDDGR